MGWASGSDIFDPVCQKIVDSVQASELWKWQGSEILKVLIRELQNHGWDCESESLGMFRDHDFVVEAFEAQGVILEDEEGDEPDDET